MHQTQTVMPLSGLRGFAVRHPITLFLVMAFGLMYPIMGLLILAQYGVIPGASLPQMFGLDMERAAAFLSQFLGLFPAAVLVTALEGGRPAVRALFRRVFRWRIGLVWWLVVVLALPGITIAIAALMGDSIRTPSVSVLADEVLQIAVAFLLINLWEETIWAGFLQTRLERRHNFFVAALLTAIPFAALHVPLRVINGTTDPVGIAMGFVFLLILGSIVRPLMGIVLRGAGDSLMAVGLMHTFFNRSNNIDGIAADLLAGPNRQIAALLATLLLTIVLGLTIRRRLRRAYRQELDAMNSEGMISSVVPTGTARAASGARMQ